MVYNLVYLVLYVHWDNYVMFISIFGRLQVMISKTFQCWPYDFLVPKYCYYC